MHFIQKEAHSLKMNGWKTILHVTKTQQQVGIAILFSEKVDYKPELIIRDKESYYLLAKGTIQQQEITTVNIYTCICI